MDPARRNFLKALGIAPAALAAATRPVAAARGGQERPEARPAVDPAFLLRPQELELDFRHPPPARRLAFALWKGDPACWREECRRKLATLAAVEEPGPTEVREARRAVFEGVRYRALVLRVGPGLSIPAYLLEPEGKAPRGAVMAIQGHGNVEGVIGVFDDYHHRFGLELARAGFAALCPALRGFGALHDLAWSTRGERCLDYWESERGPQFTLVTDGFIHGRTLIGQTVEDLLRWERWLLAELKVEALDTAGISYGGDLAILHGAFSPRVRRIFASGTFGSFGPIFSQCYNAPAHCIPGILEWMDRSDIAGLCAPRPIALHFGELDAPGPGNNSASYNGTVEPALKELRAIYAAFGAGEAVRLVVTPGRGHEMDIPALLEFLGSRSRQ